MQYCTLVFGNLADFLSAHRTIEINFVNFSTWYFFYSHNQFALLSLAKILNFVGPLDHATSLHIVFSYVVLRAPLQQFFWVAKLFGDAKFVVLIPAGTAKRVTLSVLHKGAFSVPFSISLGSLWSSYSRVKLVHVFQFYSGVAVNSVPAGIELSSILTFKEQTPKF
jgi:hypothetical protein